MEGKVTGMHKTIFRTRKPDKNNWIMHVGLDIWEMAFQENNNWLLTKVYLSPDCLPAAMPPFKLV